MQERWRELQTSLTVLCQEVSALRSWAIFGKIPSQDAEQLLQRVADFRKQVYSVTCTTSFDFDQANSLLKSSSVLRFDLRRLLGTFAVNLTYQHDWGADPVSATDPAPTVFISHRAGRSWLRYDFSRLGCLTHAPVHYKSPKRYFYFRTTSRLPWIRKVSTGAQLLSSWRDLTYTRTLAEGKRKGALLSSFLELAYIQDQFFISEAKVGRGYVFESDRDIPLTSQEECDRRLCRREAGKTILPLPDELAAAEFQPAGLKDAAFGLADYGSYTDLPRRHITCLECILRSTYSLENSVKLPGAFEPGLSISPRRVSTSPLESFEDMAGQYDESAYAAEATRFSELVGELLVN